jgi:hypothetical protein
VLKASINLQGIIMNLRKKLISSSIAFIATHFSKAEQVEVVAKLNEIEKFGFSPNYIQEEFLRVHKIELNWDEYLKISREIEGNHVNFKTFDEFSTVVLINDAHGVGNKSFQ